MTGLELKERIEFALNDLVRKRHTFSLTEVNRYLGPKNRMDFKDIFEIAKPILERMDVSWHGEAGPMRIVVSVNQPFVSKVHVVQHCFPDFMQDHEWGVIVGLFKEKGDTKWAKILGGLLAEYVKRNPELQDADFVSPVPCEKETVQKLGYDPNMLLANEVIKETGIPIRKVFSKTRRTDFCRMKSLGEKEKLVKGAFSLVNDSTVREKHVLLLDDVLNSGTTIRELTGMLEGADAKKADVLVLNQSQ